MNNNFPSPNGSPSYPDDNGEDARFSATSQAPGHAQQVAVKVPDNSPKVTYILLGLTVFIYALQYITQYLFNVDVPAALGIKINESILQGQYWRLITPVFLHGSIFHLGFNMYALYVLGPGLERYYGHARFLALYLITGFAGTVMSFLFTPAPSLGSSTAIFGLLAAEGVLLYQNRGLFGKPAQRALMNLILIGVVNLAIGLSPGIDNWGHVGGLLAGILFAWYAGPIIRIKGEYPHLIMADARTKKEVIRTGVSVILLFAALAVVTIILRT